MQHWNRGAFVLALLASAVAGSAGAQEPLEIGAVAPDFSLIGATKDGVIKDSVRLSDFRGETVVLAFFFKARTKG
jgi:thioredoxin-dependent peroxiredoxin